MRIIILVNKVPWVWTGQLYHLLCGGSKSDSLRSCCHRLFRGWTS